MKPVERVLAAVHHQEPDRVPRFYRATGEVTERLRRHFGVADASGVLERLDVDFRFIDVPYVGPERKPDANGVFLDDWGIPRRAVKNETGTYYEAARFPLADARTPADVRAHAWPKVEHYDFSRVREQLEGFADYATMPAGGIACDTVQGLLPELRGMENFLLDMVLRKELYWAMVEEAMKVRRAFIAEFFRHARGITFLRVGEDFGSQNGLLFSPAMWDECVRPYFTELAAMARDNGALFYVHSCGGVRELISRMIETGVDVLDPMQVRAAGMAPAGLKRDFGARITFCGGVDLQHLLRAGTAEDVRRGVRELIEVMAPGGGFILASTHNLQMDVPVANIIAMYEAAREFGAYPRRG